MSKELKENKKEQYEGDRLVLGERFKALVLKPKGKENTGIGIQAQRCKITKKNKKSKKS